MKSVITNRQIYEFDNDKLRAGALYYEHYGIIQHYKLFRR